MTENHATHPHQHTKQVTDQLARTGGRGASNLGGVVAGRPGPGGLAPPGAARGALDRASKLVLEDHLESCVRGAAANGMADAEWASLKEALDRFIR